MKKRNYVNDDDFYLENDSIRRKKKQKKSWVRGPLFRLLVTLCVVAIFCFSFLLLFHVRGIQVTGNVYCTADEVMEWVQTDKLATNTAYIWWKYNFTKVDQLPLVETSEVSLVNPWTIQVRVYEKSMIGYFEYDNKNIYFDKDGTVIVKSEEVLPGLPCIEGVEASDVKLHKTIKVDDKKIFAYILEVSQMVQKYELKPDRIVFSDDTVTMYFGNVTVALGSGNLTDKLMQLPPILTKLQEDYPDQKGTLHLENYTKNNSTISFAKEVSAATQEDGESDSVNMDVNEDDSENSDESYEYDSENSDESYEYDSENSDESYEDDNGSSDEY